MLPTLKTRLATNQSDLQFDAILTSAIEGARVPLSAEPITPFEAFYWTPSPAGFTFLTAATSFLTPTWRLIFSIAPQNP
jgi:hypothetical protein